MAESFNLWIDYKVTPKVRPVKAAAYERGGRLAYQDA